MLSTSWKDREPEIVQLELREHRLTTTPEAEIIESAFFFVAEEPDEYTIQRRGRYGAEGHLDWSPDGEEVVVNVREHALFTSIQDLFETFGAESIHEGPYCFVIEGERLVSKRLIEKTRDTLAKKLALAPSQYRAFMEHPVEPAWDRHPLNIIADKDVDRGDLVDALLNGPRYDNWRDTKAPEVELSDERERMATFFNTDKKTECIGCFSVPLDGCPVHKS